MSEDTRVVAVQAIVSDAMAEAQNSERLLEEIVREYSRLVFRVAYSVLRNHHDAEDVTQDTFLRVMRYGKKLGSVEDKKAWLARIAWRVAVDRRQRANDVSIETVETSALTSREASADYVAAGRNLEAFLARMIAALPSKLRDPLTLSTVEEMTPRDIGAVLGISEAAVRSRIFRAREILKEKLATRSTGAYGS